MITYQRSNFGKLIALAVVLAGVGAGAYWWSSKSDGDTPPIASQGGDKGGAPGWIQPGVGDDPEAMLKPQVMSDGRPSDVQSEDWAALNAALSKQGMGKGEADRIVSYLRYQRSFESWQVLDEVKDAKKRQRMAQALLSEIPDRLGTGEFTALEANLMGAVLVADIETDETKRNQRLEELQAKFNTISPLTEDEAQIQAKARQTELKRRQALAFADWQAKTETADRTPAKLEQALEEVRRAYNSGEF